MIPAASDEVTEPAATDTPKWSPIILSDGRAVDGNADNWPTLITLSDGSAVAGDNTRWPEFIRLAGSLPPSET